MGHYANGNHDLHELSHLKKETIVLEGSEKFYFSCNQHTLNSISFLFLPVISLHSRTASAPAVLPSRIIARIRQYPETKLHFLKQYKTSKGFPVAICRPILSPCAGHTPVSSCPDFTSTALGPCLNRLAGSPPAMI